MIFSIDTSYRFIAYFPNARLDEADFEERVIGIEKATASLKEAKVEDEKIIYLLQKYWDLRLSEAKEFLQQERYTEEK